MPSYPIPPWLRPPPDPGEEYVQSFHAGAAIAGEQARLQTQAVQAQQQHEMEKQRLEIGKQQAQLEFGLKQQELQQQQQLVQIKTQEAARKFQAHQTFRQLIDSGVDPAKALLQVGPDLGTSMVGAAQLYKQTRPMAPPQVQMTPGGREYVVGPGGSIHTFGAADIPGRISQMDAKRLSDLQRRRAEAEKADIPLSEAKKAARTGETSFEAAERLKQEKVADYQSQIDAILSGGSPAQGQPAAGPPSPSVPPAAGTNAPPIRIISIKPKSGRTAQSDAEDIEKMKAAMGRMRGFGG